MGNPTAAGIRDAANAIGLAAEHAIAGLAASELPVLALIAMAGEKTPAFKEQVTGQLAALGVPKSSLSTTCSASSTPGLPPGTGTP